MRKGTGCGGCALLGEAHKVKRTHHACSEMRKTLWRRRSLLLCLPRYLVCGRSFFLYSSCRFKWVIFFFCPYFDTPHNHLHHFVALVPLCWRHRLYISFIFGKLLAFRRHKSLSCVLHIPAAGSSTIFIFRWAHVIRLKIDFMRTMYLHAFHIEHAFQLMFPFV